MPQHKIASHEEWIAARKDLLAKEKEFTRLRDDLSRQRRELPWEKVDKDYVFDGPNGKESLSQLFAGKSQLIVYHFMFAPEWEAGCKSCSFWADNFNGIDVHLKHRDISFVAISRAPLAKLEAYRKRLGWSFKWLSSAANSFNFDYGASFTPEELASGKAFFNYKIQKPPVSDMVGISVFVKDDDGKIYHTYSTYERGVDMMNGAYHYIDLTPKGRNETDTQSWVRRHDEYAD
jgi:predicted dithiol-disulfide oxidoreductase (DUF899 family)